jgi:hypothetical protein
MISQKRVDELIEQWDIAYETVAGGGNQSSSEEFQRAASTLVWTLIQLKDAGYQLSEQNGWCHKTELHLYTDKIKH